MRPASTFSIIQLSNSRADMKDHLSQRDTLTERLKNKYSKALAILL